MPKTNRKASRMRIRSSLKLAILVSLTPGALPAADPVATRRGLTAEDLWAVKRPAAPDPFPDENQRLLHPQNSVFWCGPVHARLGSSLQ